MGDTFQLVTAERCARMAGAAALLLLAVTTGCEDRDDEPRRRERLSRPVPSATPTTSPSAAIAALAKTLEAGAAAPDPAPAGGDLAADIAAFTSIDACVAQHGVSDAVVGDALLALGYDTFTRDACRVLQGAKQKSVGPCREITVSTLRRHCETVVAIVSGDETACPEEAGGRARDGSCIALALRDTRLCAAEYEPKKTRCEAMILGNAKRCATHGEGRASCERDVARFRSILGDAKQRASLGTPSATFVLAPTDAGAPIASPENIAKSGGDLIASFGRGALVFEEPSGARRIELGTLAEAAPLLPTYQAGMRMIVELPPFPDGGKPPATGGKIRRADFQLPHGPSVSVPPAIASFEIRWKKLELERGGALELEIEGTAGEGADSVRARVDVRSFVRDVVTGPAAMPRREPTSPTTKPKLR